MGSVGRMAAHPPTHLPAACRALLFAFEGPRTQRCQAALAHKVVSLQPSKATGAVESKGGGGAGGGYVVLPSPARVPPLTTLQARAPSRSTVCWVWRGRWMRSPTAYPASYPTCSSTSVKVSHLITNVLITTTGVQLPTQYHPQHAHQQNVKVRLAATGSCGLEV